MENLTSSIYEELEEIRQKIQANIGLLELFADKLSSNIYDIHPEVLFKSKHSGSLSSFLKKFHVFIYNNSEKLSKDLTYFEHIIHQICFSKFQFNLTATEDTKFDYNRFGNKSNRNKIKSTAENTTNNNCKNDQIERNSTEKVDLIFENAIIDQQHNIVSNTIQMCSLNVDQASILIDENEINRNSNQTIQDLNLFPTSVTNKSVENFNSEYDDLLASTRLKDFKANDEQVIIQNYEPVKDLEKFEDLGEVIAEPKKDLNQIEQKNIVRVKKVSSHTNLSNSGTSLGPASKSSKLTSGGEKFRKLKFGFINCGMSLKCYVSHVESPILFFIHFSDWAKKLEFFAEEINKFYSSEENSENYKCDIFDENQIYAGKFIEDSRWYRIRIISVNCDEKTAHVYYIDYGNCDTIELDNIRVLDDRFFKEPVFAIPVSLAYAFPVNETKSWTDEVKHELSDLLINRLSKIELSELKKWPVYFCNILPKIGDKYEDTLEYLKERKLAIAKMNLDILEQFKEEIENYDRIYNFKDFFPELSSDCSDEKTNSKQSSGTISTNSSLINIKNKQKSVNELIPLNKKPSKTLSDISESRSRTQVLETEFKILPLDKYQFEIYELPKKKVKLDQENSFKLEIANIISPYEIYVHEVPNLNLKKQAELDEMLNEFYSKNQKYLASFSKTMKYSFVFVNAICVAQSPKSKYFYRALIKHSNNLRPYDSEEKFNENLGAILVNYIDYGIEEHLDYENLYPMIQNNKFNFFSAPANVILCRLDMVKPLPNQTWTEKEKNFLIETLKGYKTYIATVSSVYLNGYFECDLSCAIRIKINKSIEENEEIEFGLIDQMVLKSFALFDVSHDDLENLESASAIAKKNKYNEYEASKRVCINLPGEDENLKISRINKFILDCASYSKENIDINNNQIDSIYIEENLHKQSENLNENNDTDSEFENVSKSKLSESKKSSEPLNSICNSNKNELNNSSVKNGSSIKSMKNSDSDPKRSKIISDPGSVKTDNKYIEDPQLENWNPQRVAYDSAKNFYGFNENNGEALIYGHETRYEKNVCYHFNKFGICKRKRCPFLHKKQSEELVTSIKIKQKAVYFECFNREKFDINEILLLANVAYLGDSMFEATFKKMNPEYESSTNAFDDLINWMCEYYSNKKFLPEKSTVFRINQLVAVRNKVKNTWMRARILDYYPDENIDLRTYKVEYLDFQRVEMLNIHDIYLINSKFLALPPQKLTFCLSKLVIESSKLEIEEYLNNLNDLTLYAKVYNASDERIDLKLFGILNDVEYKNINKELVHLGYASETLF